MKRRYMTRGLLPKPTLAELAAMERPIVATPEDILLEREEAELLYRAMEKLPARHERVLRLHNGINCKPETFDAIGEQIGCCGGRVAQIEQTSCRRLVMPLLAKFRHRPGARRIRRELDEARQAEIRAQEFAREQRRINEERHAAAELERAAQWRTVQLVQAAQREQERKQRRQAEQRERVKTEILRRAELIELELDEIPRRRQQLVASSTVEYAEMLRALTLPHYRMRV